MHAVLIFALVVTACDGARILALTLFPGRSHWIVMEPLFQELAARGHQLTVYSPFPQKKPLPNYTDVDFSHLLRPLVNEFSMDMLHEFMPSPWHIPFFIYNIHEANCAVLKEPVFQDLLKSKDQYDLLITEVFGCDCFTYFAHKLQIPMISITTSMSMPWSAERVGLPDNPAYIPNYVVCFSPKMTLWERTYNTLTLIYSKLLHYWLFNSKTQALVEKGFGESLPPVQEVVANTSLLFVNSYYALSQSRPFPPNVIEVGGIHIKERQPLPEDLQKILDNSQNGVIMLSFGSHFRTATIPRSTINMFLKAFSKLKQTVIFKFEEDLPEVPPNVVIKKWLPQRDLIEHKNVLAVIAHGGLSSTIEAVYFGKPIIGIPFFADQNVNIKAVVHRGAGIKLAFDEISEERISVAISEILTNPKYTENMRLLSQQFRDRPQTALQTAVFWTEYVIRHKGAPHLRPASVDLPFYQYLLLDVVAFVTVSAVIILYVVYLFTKYIMSAIKGTSKVPKIGKSKKTN